MEKLWNIFVVIDRYRLPIDHHDFNLALPNYWNERSPRQWWWMVYSFCTDSDSRAIPGTKPLMIQIKHTINIFSSTFFQAYWYWIFWFFFEYIRSSLCHFVQSHPNFCFWTKMMKNGQPAHWTGFEGASMFIQKWMKWEPNKKRWNSYHISHLKKCLPMAHLGLRYSSP